MRQSWATCASLGVALNRASPPSEREQQLGRSAEEFALSECPRLAEERPRRAPEGVRGCPLPHSPDWTNEDSAPRVFHARRKPVPGVPFP